MAYEFLQHNMPEVLPSLRTVQQIVHSKYSHIEEGIFRFDNLLNYLQKTHAPLVVAIAEDATRIVQKVEYDPTTNRCVGFVLPNDEKGLPQINACLANTFEELEEMFLDQVVSKYAYLYTVTPLKAGIPSFTLACIGTNNKFTAKDVLLSWQYIRSQLAERGITLLTFAADGDSWLMSAILKSANFSPDTLGISPTRGLRPLDNTHVLQKWLSIKLLPLSCIQDIVHLGVKLKARLLKPSIVLPLGSFIASRAHLQVLTGLHGKDEHGLRLRDIDHRDEQNFDAVDHIISASYLLENMPEAAGTKHYIELMSSSIYSFLDKSKSPEERIEEMWYAVFFCSILAAVHMPAS